MERFSLQILTPDGLAYDGEAERVICRTTEGDVAIMARHCNYCVPVGMGSAHILVDGQARYAACMGGMLSVIDGKVRLLATTWEWADEIDLPRAQAAKAHAEKLLADHAKLDARELEMAQARLKRALVRTSVASK